MKDIDPSFLWYTCTAEEEAAGATGCSIELDVLGLDPSIQKAPCHVDSSINPAYEKDF